MLKTTLGIAVAVLAAAPATASAENGKALCIGITTIGPPSNFSSTVHGDWTIEEFDFTGVHDLCLEDGSIVAAPMVGHIRRMVDGEGAGHLVVHETLSIPGGTLDGTVRTRFTPTTFDARVHVSGGTGVLSGVSGHGVTEPTGPNTFLSHIVYKYR
jgi:hypothetical protein